MELQTSIAEEGVWPFIPLISQPLWAAAVFAITGNIKINMQYFNNCMIMLYRYRTVINMAIMQNLHLFTSVAS